MESATCDPVSCHESGSLRPHFKNFARAQVSGWVRVFDPFVPVCAGRELTAQADGFGAGADSGYGYFIGTDDAVGQGKTKDGAIATIRKL